MAILIQLLMFAAIAGVVLWLVVLQGRKARANLQALAQRQGLTLTEKKTFGLAADLQLAGEAAGRPLRFWSYQTGSGKSRTTWVAVSVQPRAAGRLTFELRRQGFTTRIMEFFGTKEIAVGDAAFDAAWFVQTNQPEFLAAALVPEIRARGMAALAARAKGSFSLKDGAVRYAEQGTLASAVQLARLQQQVPLLHYLADLTDVAAAAERG